MQAPQWKDIEAVPTRYKTAYDRACEAANQKAQKIQESADAPTWLKNDYDRAYDNEAAQAELNQKALEAYAKHELEQQQQRNAIFLRRMNQDILFLFKPKQ